MNILVTGAAGFIGSHLSERLVAEGHQVYALDIVLRGNKENINGLEGLKSFYFFETSILNENALEMLIKKCDMVYHLAAAVGVENIIGDILKVININVDGTKNVASLAYKYGKKIVFTSTSEIYGKSAKIPFKEDDDRMLGPTSVDRWVYSSTKALGEYMLIGYHRQGLPMSIVRFFNAYGPRLDIEGSGRVMSRFIVQALKGEDITVIGDGSQTRCFTYIDDVVEGLLRCGQDPKANGHTFNIGSCLEVSILELAQTVKKITGSKSKIAHIDSKSIYGSGYEDIQRRVPDISKADELLGFKATTTFEEGMQKTVDWFKQRKNSIAKTDV